MDQAKCWDDAVSFALPSGPIYLGSPVPARQLYSVKCERMHALSGVQNCKHRYHISIAPFALCSAVRNVHLSSLSLHWITLLLGDTAACGLAAATCWSKNFIVLERNFFFSSFKSSPSLPWVMFFKVDSLSRSKQEWMPRLACEERQINKTAGQLMRSSFAEIDLCGHFWIGDKKSVCGRCLLICSGSLSAWSMLHRGRQTLPWGVFVYLFIYLWREYTHKNETEYYRLDVPDRLDQKKFSKPGSDSLIRAWH